MRRFPNWGNKSSVDLIAMRASKFVRAQARTFDAIARPLAHRQPSPLWLCRRCASTASMRPANQQWPLDRRWQQRRGAAAAAAAMSVNALSCLSVWTDRQCIGWKRPMNQKGWRKRRSSRPPTLRRLLGFPKSGTLESLSVSQSRQRQLRDPLTRTRHISTQARPR